MAPIKGFGDTARRMGPLLAAAGVMGFGAVALMQSYLNSQLQALKRREQQMMANYQDPVDVIIAVKDLEAGTVIDSSHMKLAKIPERFIQPYATRAPNELMGLVTMAPIAEGEQVLVNKLRRYDQAPTDASTLSALTPKGKRAVTIGVGAITAVGGFVRPGDFVDVLWTFKLPGPPGQEDGAGQPVTLTLFQDVPVLAVGREMLGRSRQMAETSPDYTVTLALPPQEASFLLFAREQGAIQLTLRSQVETRGAQAIPPTNINTLIQSGLGLQLQPPKPQGPALPSLAKRTAEVCKGLDCNMVVVSGKKVDEEIPLPAAPPQLP